MKKNLQLSDYSVFEDTNDTERMRYPFHFPLRYPPLTHFPSRDSSRYLAHKLRAVTQNCNTPPFIVTFHGTHRYLFYFPLRYPTYYLPNPLPTRSYPNATLPNTKLSPFLLPSRYRFLCVFPNLQ